MGTDEAGKVGGDEDEDTVYMTLKSGLVIDDDAWWNWSEGKRVYEYQDSYEGTKSGHI